jgi:hypothetical protein
MSTGLKILKDKESMVSGNADLLTILKESVNLNDGLSVLIVSDPVANLLFDELALVILCENEVSILDLGDLNLLSLIILINLGNKGISGDAAISDDDSTVFIIIVYFTIAAIISLDSDAASAYWNIRPSPYNGCPFVSPPVLRSAPDLPSWRSIGPVRSRITFSRSGSSLSVSSSELSTLVEVDLLESQN